MSQFLNDEISRLNKELEKCKRELDTAWSVVMAGDRVIRAATPDSFGNMNEAALDDYINDYKRWRRVLSIRVEQD
jgi:hypothetical protein